MRTSLPSHNDEKLLKYNRYMIALALNELDIGYTMSTKEAVVRCVFHADSDGGKPNLYINIETKAGAYHCFRCGASGMFSEYIQKVTGWSIVKTLQYVLHLSKRVKTNTVDEGALLDDVELPSDRNAKDSGMAELAEFDVYCDYLADRGVSQETALRHHVSFDRATNQVILPWFAANGNLVTIKRRKITDKFYSYPKNVDLSNTLYGLELVPQHAIVWVVEGEFDTLAMSQFFRIAHYEDHAVVGLGGSALRPSQLQALLRRQPQALVYFFDNDEGGEGALLLARRIVGASVTAVVASYEKEWNAKDPDALTFEQKLHATNTVMRLLGRLESRKDNG